MYRFSLTLFLIVFFAAVADAAAIRQKTVADQSYCSLQDLFAGNGFRTSFSMTSTTGSKKGYTCVFSKNQRRMVCNNVKVELLLPTIYDKTHPWLSVLDWYKTLRPVLYPATVPKKKVSTIMIDMGHGGSDPGALGVFSKEKMIGLNYQYMEAE